MSLFTSQKDTNLLKTITCYNPEKKFKYIQKYNIQ